MQEILTMLKGNQKELDLNGNRRVDGEDLERLRAGEKKAGKNKAGEKKRKDEQFIDRVIGVLLEMRLNEGKGATSQLNRGLAAAAGHAHQGPGAAVAAGRQSTWRKHKSKHGTAGGGSTQGNPEQRRNNLLIRQGLPSPRIP